MARSDQIELHGSELLTKPRKKYSDDEALGILNSKASAESRGRDIVHNQLERLWFECCAQFVGNDGAALSAVFSSLDQAPIIDNGDDMFHANHVQGFVMRQVSRLCASKGRFQTLPSSSDWRDQQSSKVGDALLDYWYGQLNMRGVRRDLAFWQVVCGSGFVYTAWDEKEGKSQRIYRNPIDDEPKTADQLDPKTRAMYEVLGAYSDLPEGDMDHEAISPFQVLVPSSVTRLEKAPWVVIERLRSMEWLWTHYPKLAPKVRPEDFLESKVSYYWRRLAGLVLNRGAVLPGTQNAHDESVIVREFWRPPSPMLKDGARIVATQSMILENSPHPAITHDLDIRFPVRMARYQQVPGRLWGMGLVEHLIGVQREYNRARNQIISHRDVLAHPQWLKKVGTHMTGTRTNIGDFLEWEGMAPPILQNPPTMSQTHLVTKDDAMNDMRLIASQTEVTQGQTIPGVRSGTAIRALQERDMETVGPAYEEHEEAMQHVASDLLKWTKAFMTETRAIRVYGKDSSVDVRYFKGSDLRNNTTVHVQQGSMAPKSKAMAQENVLTLLQLGALNPQDPTQQRVIMHALEIGDMDDQFSVHDRNIRRAEQENDMFANPQMDQVTGRPMPPPDVMDFDDHILHHERHVAFMLTDTFENMDPAGKMIVMAHDAKHMKKLAEMQMMMMNMQATQQPQGSPPRETGKPSAPKKQESTA